MEIRRGLIGLAVLGALGAAELAVAAGPPAGLQVNVVNTPANPVPVTGSLHRQLQRADGLSGEWMVWRPDCDDPALASRNNAATASRLMRMGFLSVNHAQAPILGEGPTEP